MVKVDPYKRTYILKRIMAEGSFEQNYPEKALDWDYDDERNYPYKPSDFLFGSNKKVYWKCHVCGYKSEKPISIYHYVKNKCSCRQCAKNMEDSYKKAYILKRIEKEGSFEQNYPEKALDWDYDDERNYPYKPSDFLSSSNKKIYWKCHVCGYKSEKPQTINCHAKTRFPCKQCAQKNLSNSHGDTPITVTNPELLEEWDYSKNQEEGIYPEKITSHNTITQIHWICKRGHTWRKSVSYRINQTSGKCPKCQKEKQTSFPEQALFFYFSDKVKCINGYPIKNNSHIDIYMPEIRVGIEYDGFFHKREKKIISDKRKDLVVNGMGITLYRVIEADSFGISGNKIYVKPDKKYIYLNYAIEILCQFIGVEYTPFNILENQTAIYEQYLTLEKERSIAKLYPHLLKEWDYEKNGKIDPEYISCGSASVHLFWKCEKGHSYLATAASRTKGYGCKYCSSHMILQGFNDLKTLRPDLMQEWDFEENDKLNIFPDKIGVNYRKKCVYWKCKNNSEHKWPATVSSRNYGSGCIFCAEEKRKESKRRTYILKNGSFAEKCHDLLEDWDYDNNEILPENIPTHYSERVYWKCHICGHSWHDTPDNRANGKGCKKCMEKEHSQRVKKALLKKYGSLAQNNPEVLKFWDYENNGEKQPENITSKCTDVVNWKCPMCNHRWPKKVQKMTLYPRCPKCGYNLNEEKKIVIQYDLNLNFIAKFDSIKDASKATKVDRKYIISNINHKLKSTNGYVFCYEEEKDKIEKYKPTHQPAPKAVLQYALDGTFIKEWKSIREAEKYYPLANKNIASVCTGKRKTAAGYIWKYRENE